MSRADTTAAGWRRTSLTLALAGLAAWFVADLSVARLSPGQELLRMLHGFLTPDFSATEQLGGAVANTLAFALQGVALGAVCGFLLALLWHRRPVRLFAASIRAVHELFWGLIFLQITGLSPLTAVLAVGVPYAGIFAKILGELMEEADPRPAAALPGDVTALNRFFYARLPLVWAQFRAYGAYRLECAIRSSAILGFIGLPTIGFYLQTDFTEGYYSAGAALLYLFFIIIGTQRLWLHRRVVLLYLAAALTWAPPVPNGSDGLWRFLSHDIVPAPLREHRGADAFGSWLQHLMIHQAGPGLWNTVVLGMAALLLTGLLALLLVPLISPLFGHRVSRAAGHLWLVMLRSTPEFFLAFVFLILLGPSMLPGIIALSLHTGSIVAHLTGRFTEQLRLRDDAPRGVNRYAFEVLPRVYPNFLAFLLYRWEIIMRETSVLGILGIHTLGFYIDAGFAEFRFDRAMVLILVTVVLNLLVDGLSRILRKRLKLADAPA